jgi:hypothetical protein
LALEGSLISYKIVRASVIAKRNYFSGIVPECVEQNEDAAKIVAPVERV